MPRFAIPLALVAALVLTGGLAMVVVETSDDDPVASAGNPEGAPDEAGSDAPVEPQDDPAEPEDDPADPQGEPAEPEDDPAEPEDDPADPQDQAAEADDDPVQAQSDDVAGDDPDAGSEDMGSAERGDADGESAPADTTAQTIDPDDDRDTMALPETGADGPLLLLGATVVAAAGTSRRSH